jgi:hypothetical protein
MWQHEISGILYQLYSQEMFGDFPPVHVIHREILHRPRIICRWTKTHSDTYKIGLGITVMKTELQLLNNNEENDLHE